MISEHEVFCPNCTKIRMVVEREFHPVIDRPGEYKYRFWCRYCNFHTKQFIGIKTLISSFLRQMERACNIDWKPFQDEDRTWTAQDIYWSDKIDCPTERLEAAKTKEILK